MARVLVIVNPAAARTAMEAVQAVARTMERGGWSVELAATGGPGDAQRLAAAGRADRMDAVAVFGGDGTVMQAAAALVGSGLPLGLIPGGTGNLLAGNLRLPSHPVRAARVLLAGRTRAIDLGRMPREDGLQYFAVACGAGYDARVMAGTSAANKRRWRQAAYMATIVRLMPELRLGEYRITVDGTPLVTRASLVLVANCGELIPPFVRLRRGVVPDDGILDVVVIRATGYRESARAAWDILREAGREGDAGGRVSYARGTVIRVETDPMEPVELDGEAHGVTPFEAGILPRALEVFAPAPDG